MRFVRQPPGYIWSFPRADHLAIGICAPADAARAPALRDHLGRWLASQNLVNDEIFLMLEQELDEREMIFSREPARG